MTKVLYHNQCNYSVASPYPEEAAKNVVQKRLVYFPDYFPGLCFEEALGDTRSNDPLPKDGIQRISRGAVTMGDMDCIRMNWKVRQQSHP